MAASPKDDKKIHRLMFGVGSLLDMFKSVNEFNPNQKEFDQIHISIDIYNALLQMVGIGTSEAQKAMSLHAEAMGGKESGELFAKMEKQYALIREIIEEAIFLQNRHATIDELTGKQNNNVKELKKNLQKTSKPPKISELTNYRIRVWEIPYLKGTICARKLDYIPFSNNSHLLVYFHKQDSRVIEKIHKTLAFVAARS